MYDSFGRGINVGDRVAIPRNGYTLYHGTVTGFTAEKVAIQIEDTLTHVFRFPGQCVVDSESHYPYCKCGVVTV